MPIRNATAADIPTLVDLMVLFYRESAFSLQRHSAKAAFRRLLADSSFGRIWICELANEPVGYIVLTLGFSMEYGGRDAFVDDLFIRPEFRGKGWGRQLLDTLVQECIRIGVRALHLEVGRDNHRVRSLYRSRGFRDNERQLLTLKLDKAIHESGRHPEAAGTDSS
jgi:ribosomal protein S18 acetylase RimI-like enzyme